MAQVVDRFDFRPPDRTKGWTEDFCPGQRRSACTGSVVQVASEAILDDLDEQRWDASFAQSQEALSRLAAQAERDDKAGLTDELDRPQMAEADSANNATTYGIGTSANLAATARNELTLSTPSICHHW